MRKESDGREKPHMLLKWFPYLKEELTWERGKDEVWAPGATSERKKGIRDLISRTESEEPGS